MSFRIELNGVTVSPSSQEQYSLRSYFHTLMSSTSMFSLFCFIAIIKKIFLVGQRQSPLGAQGFIEDFQNPDSYLGYGFDIRRKRFCSADGTYHNRSVHYMGQFWNEFSDCDSKYFLLSVE